MTGPELDKLIEALKRRIAPSLASADPIAADFYGKILEALGEFKEHIRMREMQMGLLGK